VSSLDRQLPNYHVGLSVFMISVFHFRSYLQKEQDSSVLRVEVVRAHCRTFMASVGLEL
jgi:hypothetical protein